MALCRDVHFTDYATNPTVKTAASELSKLSAFFGPKSGGNVTAQTLFRGFTADDIRGPYVSQLLMRPFSYGQIQISGQIQTFMPGVDYMTHPAEWLSVKNGEMPSSPIQVSPQPRYICTGRDLAAYVHNDQIFQAFYNAAIWLFTHSAPLNPGNPYVKLTRQSPFATFGGPHFLCGRHCLQYLLRFGFHGATDCSCFAGAHQASLRASKCRALCEADSD